MNSSHIRVVLVDDHPAVRSGLESLFAVQPALKLVGRAHDGNQGVKVCRELQPDIILLDYWLPDAEGIHLIAPLHRSSPRSKIIVISSYFSCEQEKKILAAGADATYTKTAPIRDLLTMILRLAHPQPPAPAPTAARTRKIRLSRRETAVLHALAQGYQEKEIMEALDISAITFRFYRRRLLLKLKAHNVKKLIELAQEYRLLENVPHD